MAFLHLAAAVMLETFCAQLAAESSKVCVLRLCQGLCVPVLIGFQPLEQSASGSVNGDNAAQPAATAGAGVDSSASAHAIQVCTT